MYINNVIASYHNFTYQIFCRFGCPKIIISDQDREFVNEVSKHLFAKTQTQHRVTSAYHPQTNGLTERFNQMSFSLIAKINEDQSNWDMLLDPILFSYRVTRQSSTKYSPYFMMFGRHPRLPIDAEFDLNEESYSEPSERDIEQAMENLVKIHKDITSKATVNISEAQKVQKDYYDRKHAPILMNKGAQVLIENTAQRERKGGETLQ